MSSAAKPRGLGDLDVFRPAGPPATPNPAPPPKPAASPARSTRAAAPRRAKPADAVQPAAAPRSRLRIRSQVFYLPDEHIDSLNRLSRQTERSKSDLVREAITEYLERR